MRSIIGLIVMLAGPSAVAAHHSISGAFDMGREVRIEATVTEFRFVNPHPFVVVETAAAGGQTGRWRLELDNRSELVGIGMTAETFEVGDVVRVTGNPARSDEAHLYVRRLEHADFSYEQVGSRPRVSDR